VTASNFVKTNGVSLRYEIVGNGPLLCLINGLRLHGGTWPASFLKRLTEHFSVLTYDARGTGLSDKPSGGYEIANMAQDAVGMISELGYQRAHVMGFSMGGTVAQELALRYPRNIDRVALFATFAGLGFTVPAPWSVQRRLFNVDRLPPEEAVKQMWPITYASAYLSKNGPAVEAQMRREIAFPTPDYAANGQGEGLRRFSSGLRLWRLRGHALVVTGTDDQIVPPCNSRFLASAIFSSRLHIIPDLGHRLIWEAPEEMADLLIDFMKAPTSR
jgi:3-oxoadipate enol-lactonase